MGSTPSHHVSSQESGGGAWPIYLFWFGFLAVVPRLFIIGLWIFGSQLGDAFSSWIIATIGFFVAPSTTLAYALMWGGSSNGVHGIEWLLVAFGVLMDLWMWGSLARARPTD